MQIPFYKPLIDKQEFQNITQVLNLDNIRQVDALEKAISDAVDAPYVVSTCNATSAFHLALGAIELKRADKILMSVNSFVSLPEVVRHFDAEPIFIDIQKDGLNIDLDKLEKYLKENNSKKLRGLIVSFVAGEIPDLHRLYEIKRKYNIILIEDATMSLGGTYKGNPIGSMDSDISIFSTSYTNGQSVISNSGFITTHNETIFNRAKLLRVHALKTNYDQYGNLDYIYDVCDIGYKYDMTEIEAAFNLAQFNKIEAFTKRRLEIAKIYNKRLANLKHISLPSTSNKIYSHYIIKISKNRDAFARALRECGITTALTYIPLHLLTYYKKKYKIKITAYPNALDLYSSALSLPIYPALLDEEVEYICDEILRIENDWI